MERQVLVGLQPYYYEHPLDRSALEALQGTPGLETLVRKVNEYGFERLLRIQYTGSNLKVTSESFPDIHETFIHATKILNLAIKPDLYLQEGHGINAFTAGIQKPIVILNSACIDHLSLDELLFIIGHELGHVKSGHSLYHQIGALLPMIGGIVSDMTFGLGRLVSATLYAALMHWRRMSEFTADRAGLLVAQNRDASISAMIKVAGLPFKMYGQFNIEDFVGQAREFQDFDANYLDKIAKFLSSMDQSHPWTVLRAAEFDRWTRSGEYNRILTACEDRAGEGPRFCTYCRSQLVGDEQYCPACGRQVIPPSFPFS